MEKLRPVNYEIFNTTFSRTLPERFNFAFDVLDKRAEINPTARAMIHIDDSGICRTYDYAFFSRASNRLANALSAVGIAKGDRVMLVLYRRVEFWISMLALHKIGAVAVPSPAMLTVKDIEYRVRFAGIKGVIAEDSVASVIQSGRASCPSIVCFLQVGSSPLMDGWEDFDTLCSRADEEYARPEDAARDDDPLLIFFSSGTSGNPKMVEHTHRYPLGHLATALYWHDLEPDDVHLTVADSGWGKAVWGKFYGQWTADAVVLVYDFRGKFEPAGLLEVLEKYHVTSFCAPPTVYRFLIREDLSRFDLSGLRHCTTAGESLNKSVFYAWKKATGLLLYEGYGQTETTLQIATFPFMKPKPGSIGKPVPGWDVVLLDGDDQPCPPGVEGEICIDIKDGRPVGLFTGYLQDPDKTAETNRNGYYHTGDKAWIDEEGYYWFMGRVDDLIKSSGYRVGPYEVESVLVSHDAVLEVAVTGLPDPVRGEVVKATVVLNPGFSPSKELTRELQNHVKTVTAPYKYPRVIEYVDALPKTINGKIKRAQIRAVDRQRL